MMTHPLFTAVRHYGSPALVAGWLSVALLMPPALALAQSAAALEDQRYDIPAQPVAQALAEFATASGISIIYRQSLAGERLSTPLSGVYAAPAALRKLLQGTGLSARFTGPSSAIIYITDQPPPADWTSGGAASGLGALYLNMAEVRAPRLIGKPDTRAYDQYAQRTRTEIFDRLKHDGTYKGHRFRVEIAVAVDPQGRITEVTFVRPSQEPQWDAWVQSLLVGSQLSSPPPQGFENTMRFEIETDRLSERSSARHSRSRR